MTQMRPGAEIDFRRLGAMAVKLHRKIFLTALCLAALLALGTWMFVPPQYESSATFYANNSDGSAGITSSDITASKNLVESYIVILKTRASLEEIITYAGVGRTPEEVGRMISAGAADSTEIFEVVVRSPYPQEAFQIADAIAVMLPERIGDIWKGTSAAVVDLPGVPEKPVASGCLRNGIIGFLLGLALSAAGLILHEIFDTTIRFDGDIRKLCDYPILASIRENSTRTGLRMAPDTARSYEILRAKLRHCFRDEKTCRVIGLTGDDSTGLPVNLAYSLAQLDKRVLLVECDLHRGSASDCGLADYLEGGAKLEEILRLNRLDNVPFAQISAGQTAENPNKLLSSDKMSEAIMSLRESFDYILLALPPVSKVGDALAVTGLTDGLLLTVRRDGCSRAALEDALKQFEFMNARILGLLPLSAGGKQG